MKKTNLIKTTNNDQTISKTNPYSNKEDKKNKKKNVDKKTKTKYIPVMRKNFQILMNTH